MTTENVNINAGIRAVNENGGTHLSPADGVTDNGRNKESSAKNSDSSATNGTGHMALRNGQRSSNNSQRYVVADQQNGSNLHNGEKQVNARKISTKADSIKENSIKPAETSDTTKTNGTEMKANGKKTPEKPQSTKKKKKRKFRIGLGVRQRVDYGKLEQFNSRVGLSTGILQLVLSLEAVTLGTLQVYFRQEYYASIANVLYVWPSVVLCILSGIFGAWSHGKHSYVVFLYMVVSIFACITSCMMFGLEVNSSMVLQKNCTTSTTASMSVPSTEQSSMITESMTTQPTVSPPECNNYGLNMAVAVILAIIALFQVLISFIAAVYSSRVMCSTENHNMLVDECLSDDDDGEPPPPNAGLPQILKAQRR